MNKSIEKGRKKESEDNFNTANILKHLDDKKSDNPFE